MRLLLEEVAVKQGSMLALRSGSGQLHVDIICSVVEAHLDSLAEAGNMPETGAMSITGKARLRLAVAALHYLVDPDDVIPDSHPHGHEDDLIVLRWAARMAWGELPAM